MGLPNRYVNSLVLDPTNPAHLYAVFGGFSRRWVPNASVGHMFESKDGGATWTDISGNLQDALRQRAPSAAVVDLSTMPGRRHPGRHARPRPVEARGSVR
jgi:hypothetical protein